MYSLIPESKRGSNFDLTINKKRTMIGRSRVCDVTISDTSVSNIHAVIEVFDTGVRIYDMNSTGGTFVNGEKIVAQDLKPGDTVKLGQYSFVFDNYKREVAPPPLEMLIPTMDNVSFGTPMPSLPKEKPQIITKAQPRVKYPLAQDPRAEFSEYIFEDVEELYPIFKYDYSNASVEIIILFNDNIFSVDYLPAKNGKYRLVGEIPTGNDIEYPYLGKKDRVDFVEVRNNEVTLFPLNDYKCLSLSDNVKEINGNSPILLGEDDIIRFEKENLQIFIRKTVSPPKIAAPPVLRRDPDFIKYLLLILLFSFLFLTGMTLITVDEELEKEKVPERLATILYKKKLVLAKTKAITKTKDMPKKIMQKSPKKEEVKKTTETKVKTEKKNTVAPPKVGEKDTKKTAPAKKADPRQGPKNNITKVTPKTGKEAAKSAAKSSANSVRKSPVNSNNKGNVDTFKSINFSSTVSNLLAKGGSTKGVGQAASGSSTSDTSSTVGGSESAQAERAALKTNVGSLAGIASGKLDTSKGVRGIIDKKNLFTAGTPFRRVVLGGMDPDIIRQILIAHIPQFRYCYQKVLDKASAVFHGVVRLDFIIGASGSVTRASVASSSEGMPVNVKSCVSNVLKGIRFPKPLGGGVVEVKQPFNFYPNVR